MPVGIYPGTPGGIHGDSESFKERSERTIKEREKKLREKRVKAKEREMEGCTFNPSINKNSKRAAQMGRRDNRKVQERLYVGEARRDCEQTPAGGTTTRFLSR